MHYPIHYPGSSTQCGPTAQLEGGSMGRMAVCARLSPAAPWVRRMGCAVHGTALVSIGFGL